MMSVIQPILVINDKDCVIGGSRVIPYKSCSGTNVKFHYAMFYDVDIYSHTNSIHVKLLHNSCIII